MIKTLFLLLLSLFVFPIQAVEVEAREFFLCLYKKATNIEARTIRIHQFPEENKCTVVYSVQGQDEMISSGRWFSFCQSTAEKVITNLEKSLWKCDRMEKIQIFYSSFEPVQK